MMLSAATIERPLMWASSFLVRDVDRPAFRWAPLDGLGQLTAFLGRSFAVIENGIVQITRMKPIARCGYQDYSVLDEVFAIKRPAGAGNNEAGG